jgi:hypothetical protein
MNCSHMIRIIEKECEIAKWRMQHGIDPNRFYGNATCINLYPALAELLGAVLIRTSLPIIGSSSFGPTLAPIVCRRCTFRSAASLARACILSYFAPIPYGDRDDCSKRNGDPLGAERSKRGNEYHPIASSRFSITQHHCRPADIIVFHGAYCSMSSMRFVRVLHSFRTRCATTERALGLSYLNDRLTRWFVNRVSDSGQSFLCSFSCFSCVCFCVTCFFLLCAMMNVSTLSPLVASGLKCECWKI